MRAPLDQLPAEAGARLLSRGVVVTVLLALVLGVHVCFARGPWLDEFWSIRMGDPRLPLLDLADRRWLHDTNPVWANLLYRMASATGAETVGWLRLVLNLPAFLLFALLSLILSRRSPSRSPFYLLLAILIVALPAFNTSFSDYRFYFWQWCWMGMLLQFGHWLLVEGDEVKLPPGKTAKALGLASVFGAVGLHFVGGLIASVFVGLLLLALARRRALRTVAALAVPAALVWSSMLAFAIRQYSNVSRELDYSWIETTTPLALYFAGIVIAGALFANPVATVSAVAGRGDTAHAATWNRRRAFIGLLAASIVASGLLLLALNSVRPLIVDRYLQSWQLMVSAMIAAAAGPAISASRWRVYGVVAFACVSIGLTTVQQARERGWYATRDYITAEVRHCPATRVHAISSWRLRSVRDSSVARIEGAVFADAYAMLAREAGFTVSIVPAEIRVLDVPAACGLLLWVEHAGGRRLRSAREMLEKAELGFAQRARVRLFRSADGVVLSAERVTR